MVLIGHLTTQEMFVPELMVSFPLPLSINLSNNDINRLFDYTLNVSGRINGKFATTTTYYPV